VPDGKIIAQDVETNSLRVGNTLSPIEWRLLLGEWFAKFQFIGSCSNGLASALRASGDY